MKKIIFGLSVLIQFVVLAQENVTYQKPPQSILDLVDYERPPSILINGKHDYMLYTYRDNYKTLEDLSQDEMKLAGLRINPITNISSTITYLNNLKIQKFGSKELIQVIGLPQNPKITYISWSPDDTKLAFTHTTTTSVELWMIDLKTAQALKIYDGRLNANLGMPYKWLNDSQSLLVKAMPSEMKALINSAKEKPAGPIVSISNGSKAQNRTFQDLLKNKIDEENFETLITSEIYKVILNGKPIKWNDAGMWGSLTPSPNGQYILTSKYQKPFSYIVQYNRFAFKSIVFDLNGLITQEVNDVPLTESLPKGTMAVRTGKRDMYWRADKPATLYFIKALDEGNPEIKVEFRDELFQWEAPFNTKPVSILKTIQRFSDITWGNDQIAIAYDSWWNTRNVKTYLFNPSNPNALPQIIFDRDEQNAYGNPGNFEMEKNTFGWNVLALTLKNDAFLLGEGFTANGQFPFIDKYNLITLKSVRIYQSKYTNKLENLITILNKEKGEILVKLESPTDYPNYYIRQINSKNEPLAITNFKNPFTSIANVHKEVIKYKRKDGVELTGTLYLPVGYDMKKKEKLPMIMWAYPTEFKDKNSAGQNTSNSNAFTFPFYGSPVYWITRGYVVLDDASFPIIGEGEKEPNDTFLEQLVDNAKAAIDAVDSLGYIDRSKVAVGGHSYGAFMTANLLTHSDLFACGVARSGAYNRTLTPFGFQNEERNFWEIPTIYNTMSPFNSADKMKHPLLLVHGEADNNPGTFTLQSERYFNALKGFGAPARLVILPKESHGYVAKENILHLLWEQDQWFEKYLKMGK
ncbi:MAG: S9 family peptidase [Flavobacteriia bacterium]|nr:S9 family peptidase [Flavobacteriia bacterium]